MYKLKYNNQEFNKFLKENKLNQTILANIIGLDRTFINQIVNGRKTTKVCAYAICKSISPDLEIENLFNIM